MSRLVQFNGGSQSLAALQPRSAVEIAQILSNRGGTPATRVEQTELATEILTQAQLLGVSPEMLLSKMIIPEAGQAQGMNLLRSYLQVPVIIPQNDEYAIQSLGANLSEWASNPALKIFIGGTLNQIVINSDVTPPMERVEDIVAQTRSGTAGEPLLIAKWEKAQSDSYDTHRLTEGSEIGTASITSSTENTKFAKFGSGLKWTYEVDRRLNPQMLIPFLAKQRQQRELQMAQESVASILYNRGQNIPNVNLSTYDGIATGGISKRIKGLLLWLIARSQAGHPIDTLVVSFETLPDLMFMYAVADATNPAVNANTIENIFNPVGLNFNLPNLFNGSLKIIPSSVMGPHQILGFRKPETIERVIEVGSNIQEQANTVSNQTILLAQTINAGFNVLISDSISMLNWNVV